jgi:membrane protease subunit HflC
MKKKILMTLIALLVIGASGLIFYQVDEREYVVITQFGEPIKAVKKAGLNWKWPDPIQSVNRYDNRLKTYELGETEYLTEDKKNVMVERTGSEPKLGWQISSLRRSESVPENSTSPLSSPYSRKRLSSVR